MHGWGFEGGVSVASKWAQRQCEGDTGCDGCVAGEQAGVRAVERFYLQELVLLHNAAVIKRMSFFFLAMSCKLTHTGLKTVAQGELSVLCACYDATQHSFHPKFKRFPLEGLVTLQNFSGTDENKSLRALKVMDTQRRQIWRKKKKEENFDLHFQTCCHPVCLRHLSVYQLRTCRRVSWGKMLHCSSSRRQLNALKHNHHNHDNHNIVQRKLY